MDVRWYTHASRLFLPAIVFSLFCSTGPARAQTSLSIMALGDSLTWGYDGGPNTPQYLASLDTGGYRSPLYLALTADNINVNYVGVGSGNPSPVLTAAGQTAQDGFNGYRIDDIANNLAASGPVSDNVSNDGGYWLTGGGGTGRGPAQPNIILLQIGANDIEQGYDPLYTGTPGAETSAQLGQDTATRLGNLINQILTLDPRAYILTDGTSPLINTTFAGQASFYYETAVQSMIATEFSSKNVYYVNMHDAIVFGGFLGLYEDDGVHLNSAGYTVMGDTWASAVMADYDFADADPVPEPSTWALFLGGALALFAWRRVRMKA